MLFILLFWQGTIISRPGLFPQFARFKLTGSLSISSGDISTHTFGKNTFLTYTSLHYKHHMPWWRHQMETFSSLLALCAGNSPVTGEFPAQRPVTRSFEVFFDLRLNKRLSKQSCGWWFETPSRSLWRQRNVMLVMENRSEHTVRWKMWLFERVARHLIHCISILYDGGIMDHSFFENGLKQ